MARLNLIMLIALCLIGRSVCANEEEVPAYLYKVLSLEDWEASQGQNHLQLSQADAAFIHFSREDQLDRILSKYWADTPACIILRVATEQLPGNLVFEANPGGTSKYYHLYYGSIPLTAIRETKIVSVK